MDQVGMALLPAINITIIHINVTRIRNARNSNKRSEINLGVMITRARDDGTTEAWPTRNLLCVSTVLTDKSHVCRLCLSPGSSYSDPRYFDELRNVLRLPTDKENVKLSGGKKKRAPTKPKNNWEKGV